MADHYVILQDNLFLENNFSAKMDPALEFCMSASVCEMRGDYNFEKRCNVEGVETHTVRAPRHFHVLSVIVSSASVTTVSKQ